jgi:glycosyltransferase involved in cell wall biosynthesis
VRPFFSILIPSYNRPEYISGLLDSIFTSNFDDFEVIISDDCSPKQQEIKKVVAQYNSTKIKTYFHQINSGESKNKSFLIDNASGKFNILIGDDDRFTKDGLNTLYSFIFENPNHDIYTFGYNIIDEDSNIISKYKAPRQINISASKDQYLYDLYCADMLPLWIFHPSTFCCRAGIEKEIGYKNNVGMAEDLFFIFEVVAKKYNLTVIPSVIFEWRKIQITSKSDQLNQSSEFLSDFKARIKIYKRLVSDNVFKGKIHDFSIKPDFQNRFLIKALISDSKITNDIVNNKFLDSDLDLLKSVLMTYSSYSGIKKFILRKSLLTIRLNIFMKIFGMFNSILFIFNILTKRKITSVMKRIRY